MKIKIYTREIEHKPNIIIVVWEWDNLIQNKLKQIVTTDSKWTKY